MTILTREQIDAIESMGVQCVAVDSLFETARVGADALSAIARIREIHRPVERIGVMVCEHCAVRNDDDPYGPWMYAEWPCATARALGDTELVCTCPEGMRYHAINCPVSPSASRDAGNAPGIRIERGAALHIHDNRVVSPAPSGWEAGS